MVHSRILLFSLLRINVFSHSLEICLLRLEYIGNLKLMFSDSGINMMVRLMQIF
jgi:hypothetical protein